MDVGDEAVLCVNLIPYTVTVFLAFAHTILVQQLVYVVQWMKCDRKE